MNLAIIGGAGLLGSTTAFYAGTQNLFDEIKLIDVNPSLVTSHAMDLSQALPSVSKTKVSVGDYADLSDCQAILFAASKPERVVSSREEYLKENLALVDTICGQISAHCKDAVVITATNPADVFNYVIWERLGFARERILGFCANDDLRFLLAVSEVTGIPFEKLDGYCIGEHVDKLIYLFSSLKADGIPLKLTEEEQQKVLEIPRNWLPAYQALKCGRTAGWTSAMMLTKMLRAVALNSGEVIPCSVILDGEYGHSGVSVGLPVRVGTGGVQEICTLDLTQQEQERLGEIVQHLKGMIACCRKDT